MLHNRFAGDIFPKVQRLYDAGIEMNGQIVLCKGLNDQEELERSISDLTKYLPYLRSVSVVPVGLSKYREGLYPLVPFTKEDAVQVIDTIEAWQKKLFPQYGLSVSVVPVGLSKYREGLYPLVPFTKEDAVQVIDTIEAWQKKLFPQYGLHFVHASDEWYLLAGRELPEESRYDGYLQLENGVGMLRLLREEIIAELEKHKGDTRKRKVSFATGRLAYPYIQKYSAKIQEKYPNLEIMGYEIRNDFFGERITVSGLLTGQDILNQLEDKDLGECLLLPCNLLRSGEDVFLDDIRVNELENRFQIPIRIVEENGADFVTAVLERDVEPAHKRRQMYEQTDCSNCWKA